MKTSYLGISVLFLYAQLSMAANPCIAISTPDNDYRIAAFAVVNASDGYVNIRSGQNHSIQSKLTNGSVVYIFEANKDKSGWCTIDSPVSGQVHGSGLKLINGFTNVPLRQIKTGVVEFSNKDVKVIIRAIPFYKKNHKITFNQDSEGIIAIDNRKDIYGVSLDLPKTEYQSIEIQFADKTILLPKTAYQNLFNPILDSRNDLGANIHYDKKSDTLYISISNGDAGDSYNALLVIKNKKFQQQYIGYGF